MTREARAAILRAFDALIEVQSGAPPSPTGRRNSHGGSARCAVCVHSLAEGTPHHEATVPGESYRCPIGVALAQLGIIVPPFDKRDEWLRAGIDQQMPF